TVVDEDWSSVRIDASWHRAFVVADWPRVELPAAWLAGILFIDDLTWSLTVSFEPVPARTARQAVERQAAKLSSDDEQRRPGRLPCGGRPSPPPRRPRSP